MSLTDTMGSLAVATKGQWMTGVSTDIGTSFVRPSGRPGDILHAKATLVGMGSSSLMGRRHLSELMKSEQENHLLMLVLNFRILRATW